MYFGLWGELFFLQLCFTKDRHFKLLLQPENGIYVRSFINGTSDDIMPQRCLASLWERSLLNTEIPTGF